MTAEQWAGALVVLLDGKRMGWKIKRNQIPRPEGMSDRYFGGFPGRSIFTHETQRFDGPDCFDQAEAWCRQWERHPEAGGWEP